MFSLTPVTAAVPQNSPSQNPGSDAIVPLSVHLGSNPAQLGGNVTLQSIWLNPESPESLSFRLKVDLFQDFGELLWSGSEYDMFVWHEECGSIVP